MPSKSKGEILHVNIQKDLLQKARTVDRLNNIVSKTVGRNNLKNIYIKMSSFKSSESIQKKEGGPSRSVSDNQSSSVTLNELAMKARKDTVISSFSKEVIH